MHQKRSDVCWTNRDIILSADHRLFQPSARLFGGSFPNKSESGSIYHVESSDRGDATGVRRDNTVGDGAITVGAWEEHIIIQKSPLLEETHFPSISTRGGPGLTWPVPCSDRVVSPPPNSRIWGSREERGLSALVRLHHLHVEQAIEAQPCPRRACRRAAQRHEADTFIARCSGRRVYVPLVRNQRRIGKRNGEAVGLWFAPENAKAILGREG